MKKYLLIIFLFPCLLFGQDRTNDSLWRLYNNQAERDTIRLNAIHNIAWSYLTNNPDTAIILAEQQLDMALLKKQIKFQARALNTMGVAYMIKSDYTKAIYYYEKALKTFEEIGDKLWIGNCNTNIGNVYSYQANYVKALEYIIKATKKYEEIKFKKGQVACYINIGIIYIKQSNLTKSLENYFKALKICEEIGDTEIIGTCYNNIGNVYNRQENYSKALEYYNLVLKIREEKNDKSGIAASCGNIGTVYFDLNQYNKSIEYAKIALKLFKEIGNSESVASTYINIGSSYNKLKQYNLAVNHADSALKLGQEIADVDNQRLAYAILAEAYSGMGNYKNAYQNHIMFKELTDSIFNADNSKQLGDLKTNFEVEKKALELKAKADEKEIIDNEAKKRQRIITGSVIVGLILVLIFAILIFKRLQITRKQKHIIELKEKETQQQKHIIEEKHREITDSINYAERIQRSFIATKEILDDNLTDYFVLFKPKDVVSGDFYWASKLNNGKFAFVTADSTGHGVPGAIMSLLNITSLEKAIETLTEPSEILNSTRKTIIERLKKDGSEHGGKDGMDASLTVYDFKYKKLIVAAANNPVWIVRVSTGSATKEVIDIKPDKMPVGKHDRDTVSFTQQEIDLQSGDVVYTLTDGFPDQFGGEKGKKYMSKNLRELLAANSHLPMQEQKQLLEKRFAEWVGNLEQVDDVTLIGVRI